MQLIVFDLDFTLWNAGGTWCDHTFPPYKKVNNHVKDSTGSIIFLYPDTRDILKQLHEQNYLIAIASRTHEPTWAKELLRLFEIDQYFSLREIYPGSKIEHFNQIRHRTGIDFENMIFFDDEMRNIHEVGTLGVNAVLVSEGINREIVESVI